MSGEQIRTREVTTREGVRLHVQESGREDGPVLLLLHGFPDSVAVWRKMAPSFGAAYRVVAYDQRGFGRSDRPAETRAYTVPRLVDDVTDVLDELGVDRVHFVGHDWGANVGWALAHGHPGRVRSLTALSSGHPGYRRSIRSLEKAWYVFLFQFPNAEDLLTADGWALFREWARHHPEVPAWVENLSRPGALTSGLNLYRANYPASNGFALPFAVGSVSVPTMGVFGVEDAYLVQERMENSAAFVDGPWRFESVAAGHWLPLDAPEVVSDLILDFLDGIGD